MIDSSNRSARVVATSAVLVAAGVHCCMNASFGWNLGAHDYERYLFAAFGVSLDVCKVFALGFAAYAFERGRKLKAMCCVLVWLTTVCYSGLAAIGFASLARDTVTASRSSDADDYATNIGERKRLLAQMEQGRSNPLFQETYGCSEYSKTATNGIERQKSEFCNAYWRASIQLQEIKPVLKKATMTQADPQTTLLAKVTGYPREQVAVALSVFLAFVAEMVSALGTWTFSGSRRKPTRATQRRVEKPRLSVVK